MTDDKYISAKKLKAHYAWWGETEERKMFDAIVDVQPAADVQEVTRCKDCWAYETAEYDDGYKKRFCHLFKRQMQEDDFCSYGEPPDRFEKHSIAKMHGDKKEEENIVLCKDCKYLMFSDCYGECKKGYRGIVNPDDTCEYGVKEV